MIWDWYSYVWGITSVFGFLGILKIIKMIIEDWIEDKITEKKEMAK